MKGTMLMNHFITEIKIEELIHLSDIHIMLNSERRTNLLLTGKNGSGKSTVLLAIKQYLKAINDGTLEKLEKKYPEWLERAQRQMKTAQNETERYSAQKDYEQYAQLLRAYNKGLSVVFNDTDGIEGLYNTGFFLTAYYDAERKSRINRETRVEDVVLDTSYSLDSTPGNVLLKYLIHLKTQQAYARNEGDIATVQMLDEWFDRFVKALKVLLDNQSIQLSYDYKNYNFLIIEKGKNPFGFDQLSDGYSAVIQIVSDLILRMERNWLREGNLSTYDAEGIVLIDEIETHLHIGLQKKILAFLTEFFPNIQFIITTHSPYILNSIDNCVIYDLENRVRMENMSGYSAEGIVEGYFGLDSYSQELMEKVKRYEYLSFLPSPTDEEREERAMLLCELKRLPGDLVGEVKDAFEEIEKRRKKHD